MRTVASRPSGRPVFGISIPPPGRMRVFTSSVNMMGHSGRCSARSLDLRAGGPGLGVLGVALEDLVEDGPGLVLLSCQIQGPGLLDLDRVGLLGLEREGVVALLDGDERLAGEDQ